MWEEVFRKHATSPGTLEHGLFTKPVLPRETPPHERASAVMVSRLAAFSRSNPQRLIFMSLFPGENLACVLASGLLISDFVASSAAGLDVSQKMGLMLHGDLLLVTHAVGISLERLKHIRLGDGNVSLQEIWPIESFSHYKPVIGTKPRMFVANIGWVGDGVPGRRIGAVVVDAMHPRTLSRLPGLLEHMAHVPIAVVVVPPLVEYELLNLGYPERTRVWLWDPAAQSAVAKFIPSWRAACPTNSERLIWICDDSEVDVALADVHELLAHVQRDARRDHSLIWSAWSIYHRLRQLAVPLSQLEDSAYQTWGAVPVKKRLVWLKEECPQEVAVEAKWRGIVEGLGKVYELLLERQEPSKFWGVAERVSNNLVHGDSSLRVVMPSEREVALLSIQLGDLVDDWFEALSTGRVEVVSAKSESRHLAAGEERRTLLLGFRAGFQRHLDLYPNHSTEVLTYPYEADVDETQQDQIYGFAESLQGDNYRCEILTALRLPSCGDGTATVSLRPRISVAGYTENRVRKVRASLLDPTALDLQKLAASGIKPDWQEDIMRHTDDVEGIPREYGRCVVVRFEDGTEIDYPPWQNIDVYHPGTEQIQRHTAGELLVGMQVVSMVDGVYERLYDRLLEALHAKVSPYHRMMLALWDEAKFALLAKHKGNRTILFQQLEERGLHIGYSAVVSLFREDELEGIAPQQYSDMKVIAECSGKYANSAMIKLTFRVIQEERARRRNAGKALHSLLRAIIQGHGYEQAIVSARQLGNEIGEVFAAVQVRVVAAVRIVDLGEKK